MRKKKMSFQTCCSFTVSLFQLHTSFVSSLRKSLYRLISTSSLAFATATAARYGGSTVDAHHAMVAVTAGRDMNHASSSSRLSFTAKRAALQRWLKPKSPAALTTASLAGLPHGCHWLRPTRVAATPRRSAAACTDDVAKLLPRCARLAAGLAGPIALTRPGAAEAIAIVICNATAAAARVPRPRTPSYLLRREGRPAFPRR
mmetsp:Transcript_3565/g.9284  ORF Transcript_3565/g.9284 Transcript_3565/m.9284 type:complete len:202 (+) Transcript_3565:196-801(+)